MLWGSDLDGVAMLAKDQHAHMLADARRRQLNQLLWGRDHKHNAWLWLRRIFSGQRSQESRLEPPSMSRSFLHS
jgi:hypothetical protein